MEKKAIYATIVNDKIYVMNPSPDRVQFETRIFDPSNHPPPPPSVFLSVVLIKMIVVPQKKELSGALSMPRGTYPIPV